MGGAAESHLNSAMVLSIFPKLEDALKKSGNSEADSFISALEDYRKSVESAYLKNIGDRKFSDRAYLSTKLRFGVATFDKKEAELLLLKFSFDNFSKQYPDYWVGHWTAPDEMNSTLYREGLYCFWTSENERKTAFQGYCSHPHAWPLFCYFKLTE